MDEATSWFPGTYRWDSQLLSPASHPHLWLKTLWWVFLRWRWEIQFDGTQMWTFCQWLLFGVSVKTSDCPIDASWNWNNPQRQWSSDCLLHFDSTLNSFSCESVTLIWQHWKDLVAGVSPEDYKSGWNGSLALNKQNERTMKGVLLVESLSAEGRSELGEGS